MCGSGGHGRHGTRNSDLQMIAPMMFAAATAVQIDDDLVIFEFELGDLDVVARIHGGTVSGYGAIETFGIERFVDLNQIALFPSREGFDGFRKFTRNETDQVELRRFLERAAFGGARRLRLGLAIIG